jgi:2,4-dienoyl-CoA reductase-like NADH-dependent reductase (Old Yellow Enzyme family)
MLKSNLSVGQIKLQNRVVLQPMEGCDCNVDGSPSDLTIAKYLRAVRSGAGLIWFEANAVCKEGRTNVRQMMLTKDNLHIFKKMLDELKSVAMKENGFVPTFILQLTHSGRQSIEPMIAYRNAVYEEKRPVTDDNIVTDEYLDALPSLYVQSAKLALEAGFDGVDVKSCHGYLFQELLSAYSREGKYGGSFENRTKLYLDTIRAVKKSIPSHVLLTTRLSVTDMVRKPYGFGTNEENEIDFSEPDELIAKLVEEGVQILNVTLGNPYYNPHVNRPYRVGGYVAPESASEGLNRFVMVEKHIKDKFPDLVIVGSGLSYYRDDLFVQSEKLIAEGVCDLIGYGRMWLAYPNFYSDYINGKFDSKKCCVACSKCTALMRNKKVSGCAVFNEYYKNLYKEIAK